MENIELNERIELVQLSFNEQYQINGGIGIESIVGCCLGACAFAYQIGKDMAAAGW
jgi:cell fate regulator YaaT (PSP1 superfamily)